MLVSSISRCIIGRGGCFFLDGCRGIPYLDFRAAERIGERCCDDHCEHDCGDDGAHDRHDDGGHSLPLHLALLEQGHDSEDERDRQQNPADDERARDAGEDKADRGHDEGDEAEDVALPLLSDRRRLLPVRCRLLRLTIGLLIVRSGGRRGCLYCRWFCWQRCSCLSLAKASTARAVGLPSVS